MRALVQDLFIEPEDREAAIKHCRDRLTIAQVVEIQHAPKTALVRISFVDGQPNANVLIIPEG